MLAPLTALTTASRVPPKVSLNCASGNSSAVCLLSSWIPKAAIPATIRVVRKERRPWVGAERK